MGQREHGTRHAMGKSFCQNVKKETRLDLNFSTFDYFSDGVAISVKTLNTQTASRLADPKKIYYSAKKSIDRAMEQKCL